MNNPNTVQNRGKSGRLAVAISFVLAIVLCGIVLAPVQAHAITNEQNSLKGFIDWMLTRTDLDDDVVDDLETAQSLLEECIELGYIDPTDAKDAVNLSNVEESLEIIDKISSLRASDSNFSGYGEVYTNFTMMVGSAYTCDVSVTSYSHVSSYWVFASNEGLAWGYSDPTYGWYTQEKSYFDTFKSQLGYSGYLTSAQVSSVTSAATSAGYVVGHYTGLFYSTSQVMGVGYSTKTNAYRSLTASYNCASTSSYAAYYTVDQFEEYIEEYRDSLKTKVTTPTAASLVYNGSEQTALASTSYYTVTGGTGTDAGTYTATLSLKDKTNYAWSSTQSSKDITITWTIEPCETEVTIALGYDSVAYSGTAKRPVVTVYLPDGTLVHAGEYTVGYSNNTDVGTATVTVTASGNYLFSASTTFTITAATSDDAGSSSGVTFIDLSGATRYETMAAIVAEAYSTGETCDYAIVATATNFPDALAAASLAGVLDAPVILTNPTSATAALEVIESIGARKVYIIGGTSAVSADVASTIAKQAGATVTRLSGSTRQETALAVASEVLALCGSSASKTCFVVAGAAFPDALSASPYAYWTGSPIYLAQNNGTISDATLAAIETGGYERVIILGGTSAVSASAASALASLDGVTVTRLGGETRYETSALVAAWEVSEGMGYDGTAIATGENFPDALAGAALCGQNGSVILLVSSGNTAAIDLLAQNTEGVSTVYFLGGTSAISSSTRSLVQALFTE